MKILLILIFLPFNSFALTIHDDPTELFNGSAKLYKNANITWVTVDGDINARCNSESKKRGLGGFQYPVQACSFWSENRTNTCTIFTPTWTSMHQIGHEIRHCFQGDWHPQQ
jgi:hypothetical protein